MIFYVVFLSTLRKHCEVHHELREATVSIPRDFHSPATGSYRVKGFLCFMIRHFHCLSLSLSLSHRGRECPFVFPRLIKNARPSIVSTLASPMVDKCFLFKRQLLPRYKGDTQKGAAVAPSMYVYVLCPRKDTTPLRFCFNALSHSLSLRSRFMGLLPPSVSLSPSLSLW